MRKAARIIGAIIVSIMACVVLIGFFRGFGGFPLILEELGIIVFCILTIISAVIVWIRMRIGAWVVLVVGVLLSIFSYMTVIDYPLSIRLFGLLIPGGPLIISSFLMFWGLREKIT